jgi:hypothetical protein
VHLVGDRVTLGKAPSNDVLFPGDRTVSRFHAVLERVAGGWLLQDLGSRNGTYLNGERVHGPRALRHNDEVRVGSTRSRYLAAPVDRSLSETAPVQVPPALTPRERDVLVALCRPVLEGSLLSEPASVRDIAAALLVSDSAVKKLLARLYDKFALYDEDRRRGRLAADAMMRGAVSLADVTRA